MSAARVLTSADLCSAIRTRYCFPEWHCEPEVTLAGRRIDVVALNLWAARSYRIAGFEIKVSRGDWLRELAAFQKSEDWTAVVDAFYIVTPPKLIPADEVPQGWGLLELCGSRLMTRVQASPRPPAATLPREISARFLARLLGECSRLRGDTDTAIARAVKSEVDEKVAVALAEREKQMQETERKYQELLAALGLEWDWQPQVRVVRLAAMVAKIRSDETVLERLAAALGKIDEPLANLRALAQEIGA